MSEIVEPKELIVEYLSNGLSIKDSCVKAGISAGTFYKWLKDPKFKSMIQRAKDSRIDIAEDALMSQVLRGNPASTIFFLCNRSPERWRNIQKSDNERTVNFNIFNQVISALKDIPTDRLKEMVDKSKENGNAPTTNLPTKSTETRT